MYSFLSLPLKGKEYNPYFQLGFFYQFKPLQCHNLLFLYSSYLDVLEVVSEGRLAEMSGFSTCFIFNPACFALKIPNLLGASLHDMDYKKVSITTAVPAVEGTVIANA